MEKEDGIHVLDKQLNTIRWFQQLIELNPRIEVAEPTYADNDYDTGTTQTTQIVWQQAD